MKYRYANESWKYLYEHLYEKAFKGVFDRQFNDCKADLAVLEPFQSLKDLLQAIERNDSLKEQVVEGIKTIWQKRYKLRPAMGTVILLVIWHDLPQSNLEDFYYDLFTKGLEGGD